MATDTLTGILRSRAAADPESVAIWYDDRGITYGALDNSANHFAQTLLNNNIGKGHRVGICRTKSIDTIISLYGIMRAGACYVPLDPLATPDRLAAIAQECRLDALYMEEGTSERLSLLLEKHPPRLVVKWALTDEILDTRITFEETTTPDDIAYILFTSGSTGIPKGVVHTHSSALTFARWAASTFRLNPDDRLSCHAPLHFDLTILDIFSACCAGASTVLIPEGAKSFPAFLSSAYIESKRITVWYSVPFALMQLLDRGALDKRDLTALRCVIFAGEPFPVQPLRRLMEMLPQASFTNLFGPTETNVCFYYHLPGKLPPLLKSVPIGRPCPYNTIRVADASFNEVQAGETGELLVKDGSVMQGYINRPDLNEKVFVQLNDGIYYRTGDMVRLNAEGMYEFCGRADGQVKVRGYRIELGEVEAALESQPGILKAAAFVVQSEGTSVLHAYVLPANDAGLPDEMLLLRSVATMLPPAAVPRTIRVVSSLPVTATGKIDRKHLAASFEN